MLYEVITQHLLVPGAADPNRQVHRLVLDRPFIPDLEPQAVRSSPAVRSWDEVATDICDTLQQAVRFDGLSGSPCEQVGEMSVDPHGVV